MNPEIRVTGLQMAIQARIPIGHTHLRDVCPYVSLVDGGSVQTQNAVIDFKYFMNIN